MPKGRPSIAGEARSKSVKTRTTPAEKAAIERRAVMLGKSLSDHVRDVLLADAMLTEKKPAKKK